MATASLTALFGMDATGLKTELKQVRKSINQTAERMGKIGLAAAGAAFTKLGADALKSASSLDAASKKIGLSTDTLQELGFAAREFEINQDTVNMAMQRFARRLGEAQQGTGELLPVIKQYGIQLKDTEGNMRSAEDVLGDYANLLQKTKTPQEQLRLAFKAFDSEGVGLVNVLKDGKAGLQEWGEQAQASGEVLRASTVKSLAEAEDAIEAWKNRVTVSVGEILVNFRSKEGLDALKYGLFEAAARFGGKLIDFVYQTGSMVGAVVGGAFTGVINNFRNAMVGVLQGIALKINEVLPERFEINIGNLDQLKTTELSIGQTITEAIAKTRPTTFSEEFGAVWADLRQSSQAAADALSASRFTQSVETLDQGAPAIGHALADPIADSADKLAEAGESVGKSITQASAQAAEAFSVAFGVVGRHDDELSTEELQEKIRNLEKERERQKFANTKTRYFYFTNPLEGITKSQLANAQNELLLRKRFETTYNSTGESGSKRIFGISEFERLLQYIQPRPTDERSANALEVIEKGLRRSGIISTTG